MDELTARIATDPTRRSSRLAKLTFPIAIFSVAAIGLVGWQVAQLRADEQEKTCDVWQYLVAATNRGPVPEVVAFIEFINDRLGCDIAATPPLTIPEDQ